MNILFCNVDTQIDLMDKNSKFYSKNIEKIKPNLEIITKIALQKKIQVLNTLINLPKNSEYFSDEPDYKETFPPHCIQESLGINNHHTTYPNNPLARIYPYKNYDFKSICGIRNLMIYKDNINPTNGNLHLYEILSTINPDIIFVYGCYTEININETVIDFSLLTKKIIVVQDAIANFFDNEYDFDEWYDCDIEFMTTKELINFFK
jgi:nicotinamidase/pyrazinamidase